MTRKFFISAVIILILISLGFAVQVLAGPPDSTDLPENTSSFSLEDIYNRLASGTTGTQNTFTEPSSPPGVGTMHNINEIMALAPQADDTDGALTGQVLSGRTFWGLNSGAWGAQTGTMPNNGAVDISPTTIDQTIPAGYHNGSGAVDGDSDLIASNIRDGVTIFGVLGTVQGSTGNATDADVLSGVTYSNNSGPSSGTMPNNGQVDITPTTTDQTIPLGYHNGSGTVDGDPNLIASNIRDGATIFGVAGNVVGPSGIATDADVLSGVTYSNDSGASIGTMPNNGAVDITPTTTDQTIPAGFHNGSGTVDGDAELLAANIRSGIDIFGVAGTYTGDSSGAPVPKTGQTTVFATGDDGDIQRGVVWPDPRFTDNSDGTITDNLTGLIWLKDASCFAAVDWTTSLTNANTLASGSCGLTDGSVAGDWYMPNLRELHSLIDFGKNNPALPNLHPFTGVELANYWSSTTQVNITGNAWMVNFLNGSTSPISKSFPTSPFLLPVRGPQ